MNGLPFPVTLTIIRNAQIVKKKLALILIEC